MRHFQLSVMAVCFAALTIVAAAPAHSAPVSPAGAGFVQYETPCREVGHNHDQACAVVHKFVSGNQPVEHSSIVSSEGKAFTGRYQVYSVIYVYHLHPGGLNNTIGLNVSRGNAGMMIDLKVGQPLSVWVSTRDGGKTWSKPITTNMASAVAY